MKFSSDFYGAGREYSTFEKQIQSPCFRREFLVQDVQKLENANLTICGLGLYELYVNGINITRGKLSSYFANPDDILYYDSYDLRQYLQNGINVIGVVLGNGLLNAWGGQAWDFHNAKYRSAPKFALLFESTIVDNIESETDNTMRAISSFSFDASEFKCSTYPIVSNDIRCGEWYDARLETGLIETSLGGEKIERWTMADFDDSSWKSVILLETPRGEMRLCQAPPILPTKEIEAVLIRKSQISIFPKLSNEFQEIACEDIHDREGYLYDFGINIAGVCRIKIHNTKPGQKIILQFGELLGEFGQEGETIREDGSGLDLRGLHFLPHKYNNRDVYICKGDETEIWIPRFTYHGFRYCLVMGLEDNQAVKELLTCVVMNSAMTSRASFKCSDEVVNKLWEAGIVSDCANMYHIPTDCPHREKNGWTGDAALSAEHMLMVMSAEDNLREWMHSLRKAMLENGQIPGIVPTSGWGYDTPFEGTVGPAWDAALVEIPYCIWKYRGNLEVLKENASAILRYLHYLDEHRSERGLIEYGLGDWCQSARARVDHPKATNIFTSTVIGVDICRKAAKIFNAIEMYRQKVFAESLAEELRGAIRKHLIDFGDMCAVDRCQTAQAMAIYYGIFDLAEKKQAFELLLKLIEENDSHFDCGILGMRVLFHVLSEFGHSELAYRMITRDDFPSYGYWIQNGATSLWELFSPIERVQSSCNHHFFGDILSWFIKTLAGIQLNPFDENVNQVRIVPQFIESLNYVEAFMEAPAGRIHVFWKRVEENIMMTVTIPQGIDAELVLKNGWHFEDGLTRKQLTGEEMVRVLPIEQPDILRRFA